MSVIDGSLTISDSASPMTSWIQTTARSTSSTTGSDEAMVAGDEPIRPRSTSPAP